MAHDGEIPARNDMEPGREIKMNREGYRGVPNKTMLRSHRISLSDMQRKWKDRDIHVINNSIEKLGVVMKVTMSIRAEDGTEILLTIPDTWIPVNLSRNISNEDLFRSNAFRDAVSKGMLFILDPDFAEDILSTPIATAEQERVNVAGRDMSGYGKILSGAEEDRAKPREFTEPAVPAHIKEVMNVRATLVSAVNENNIPALLSAISTGIINEDLSDQERHYIQSHIKHTDVDRLLESYKEQA